MTEVFEFLNPVKLIDLVAYTPEAGSIVVRANSGNLYIDRPDATSHQVLSTADVRDDIRATGSTDNSLITETSVRQSISTYAVTPASDTAGRYTATIAGITSYFDGLRITVKLTVSYNATYNTININGLGEKLIWYRPGNRLTSHLGSNVIITLTYDSNAGTYSTFTGGFVLDAVYQDGTESFTVRYNYFTPMTGSTGMGRYKIYGITTNDIAEGFTTTDGVGTTKPISTSTFCLSKGIYTYHQATVKAANNRLDAAYTHKSISTSVFAYTHNGIASPQAYSPIYLVATSFDGDNFVLDNSSYTSFITQTLPTTEDGKYYIHLGRLFDNANNYILEPDHPVYYFKDGTLRVYNNTYITGFATTTHNHDDRYYTETESDTRYPILSGGIIPNSYLPSYVDDVLEYATLANFPVTGETSKIYVAIDTNRTYRWSGSAYVEISASLALGETSSTAYRGDRGKIAYDHSQTAHQTILNGSGYVKVSGTTVTYVNETYSLSTHNHALSNLSDVTITSPANTNVLSYNGTNWVNETRRTSVRAAGSTDNSLVTETGIRNAITAAIPTNVIPNYFVTNLTEFTNAYNSIRANYNGGNIYISGDIIMTANLSLDLTGIRIVGLGCNWRFYNGTDLNPATVYKLILTDGNPTFEGIKFWGGSGGVVNMSAGTNRYFMDISPANPTTSTYVTFKDCEFLDIVGQNSNTNIAITSNYPTNTSVNLLFENCRIGSHSTADLTYSGFNINHTYSLAANIVFITVISQRPSKEYEVNSTSTLYKLAAANASTSITFTSDESAWINNYSHSNRTRITSFDNCINAAAQLEDYVIMAGANGNYGNVYKVPFTHFQPAINVKAGNLLGCALLDGEGPPESINIGTGLEMVDGTLNCTVSPTFSITTYAAQLTTSVLIASANTWVNQATNFDQIITLPAGTYLVNATINFGRATSTQTFAGFKILAGTTSVCAAEGDFYRYMTLSSSNIFTIASQQQIGVQVFVSSASTVSLSVGTTASPTPQGTPTTNMTFIKLG